MLLWFGSPFNPVCEPDNEVPTPVGLKCYWCDEPIEADQSGAAIQKLLSIEFMVAHHECLFRAMMGSIGHLTRECSCYGYNDTSEHGMTMREAAIATFAWAQEHQPRPTVH